MKQKRLLSVQDISCFGKCSNTVALPVASAAGVETVVLPTALLSTHTGGFTGYTFLDLTAEMRRILAHWDAADIRFDMIYTGYFGSREQLDIVAEAKPRFLREGGIMMVDPVMGDGGKLYPAYDGVFADAMRVFCGGADIVTPNVTEACLLSGVPYAGDGYSREYMEEILGGIRALHCASAAITGVRFGEGEIGVVYEDFVSGARATVAAPRSDAPLHGTGDVFASALAGYLLAGFSPKKAVSHAVSFVSACIRDTEEEIGEHWYGVKFEGRLGMIADRVKEKQIADMLAQGRDGNDSL